MPGNIYARVLRTPSFLLKGEIEGTVINVKIEFYGLNSPSSRSSGTGFFVSQVMVLEEQAQLALCLFAGFNLTFETHVW